MNKVERQEQLKEISRDYPIPKYFDLDRISWVTGDVAITSVGGAEEDLLQEGYFVINVAGEIFNDAHACIPIDPYVEDVERQRETVALVSDTIQRELRHNGRKVVVHCHMGMERSVLAVAWWLHSYKNMSLDEAYELIRQKRPVALDSREWIGEPHPDDEVFTYA
jgi:hypothetical protein